MSRWTHSICDSCWNIKEPIREPVHIMHGEIEICCFCGKETRSGIYVRYNPEELSCKGNHKKEVE